MTCPDHPEAAGFLRSAMNHHEDHLEPKMPSRLRVYVSGPLTTSGCPGENVRTAMDITRELIHLGYAPLCPHLTWYIDPEAAIAHEVWMAVDLPWVQTSHAVLRIAGDSRGADLECQEASLYGIPVFYSVGELHKAMSGK